MKKINVVGVDYSLNSPCVCLFEGDKWSFDKCCFVYIAKKKSQIIRTPGTPPQFNGTEPIVKDSLMINPEQERYYRLTNLMLTRVFSDSIVFIEGYAFAASGRITDIAEGCSVLKQKLWYQDIEYQIVAPPTLKKFACHGRASKDEMYDAFVEETGFNLKEFLDAENIKITSPTTDIVDSYFLCKYGYEKLLSD